MTSNNPSSQGSDLAVLIGTVLAGRYRLTRDLGSGATTAIFDAVDEETGEEVTFKLIRPRLAAVDEFRDRFDEAMRGAAELRHPNIAIVHDFGYTPVATTESAFVVTERLTGGSLRDLFDRGRRLTPSQALVVGLDACRALDVAHRRNQVHGELAPSKIVFGDDRRLRIVDFGLSRLIGRLMWSDPSNVPNHVAGYASPEQATGQRVGGKSDVYSLALTLTEAITGALPFKADSTTPTLAARVGRLLPVTADMGPLASVLEHAARPDVEDRSTAAEFGKNLVQVATRLPRPEPIPLLSASPPAQAADGARRAVVGGAAGAVPAGRNGAGDGDPRSIERPGMRSGPGSERPDELADGAGSFRDPGLMTGSGGPETDADLDTENDIEIDVVDAVVDRSEEVPSGADGDVDFVLVLDDDLDDGDASAADDLDSDDLDADDLDADDLDDRDLGDHEIDADDLDDLDDDEPDDDPFGRYRPDRTDRDEAGLDDAAPDDDDLDDAELDDDDLDDDDDDDDLDDDDDDDDDLDDEDLGVDDLDDDVGADEIDDFELESTDSDPSGDFEAIDLTGIAMDLDDLPGDITDDEGTGVIAVVSDVDSGATGVIAVTGNDTADVDSGATGLIAAVAAGDGSLFSMAGDDIDERVGAGFDGAGFGDDDDDDEYGGAEFDGFDYDDDDDLATVVGGRDDLGNTDFVIVEAVDDAAADDPEATGLVPIIQVNTFDVSTPAAETGVVPVVSAAANETGVVPAIDAGGPPPATIEPDDDHDHPAGRSRRSVPWKTIIGGLILLGLVVVSLVAFRLLSTPKYVVPDLAGKTLTEAENLISPNGWDIRVSGERSAEYPTPDVVVRTNPGPQAEVAEGEPFEIVVSEGPIQVELPDLAGLEATEAQSRLQALGMVVTTERANDETVAKGEVIKWYVPDNEAIGVGSFVDPGTKIILVVSDGPAPRAVPDLVGKSLADAQAALDELGLTLKVTSRQPDATAAVDTVLSQSVAAGKKVERGSEVGVVLAEEPVDAIFPDLSGLTDYESMKAAVEAAGFTVNLQLGDGTGSDISYTIDGQVPEPGQSFPLGTVVNFETI